MFDVRLIVEWLKDKNPAAMARVSAFALAPGFILGSVISGVFGGTLGLDLARPLTISQLRTEFTVNGSATTKMGVALIVEPTPSEYHVELQSAPSHLWSSLDQQSASANQGRIVFDGSGITGKAPFLGVGEPVTVIADAPLGERIFIPGGAFKADNWQLSSRRSESIVSSALLSCVLAFGMGLGSLPSGDRDKHTTG